MKVKEYLIKRIMELEQINKESAAQYQGLQYALRDANKRCDELIDKVDQLTMEREHIKQIITCNIVEDLYGAGRYCIDLSSEERDFETLLAILDINPEDYTESQKELVHEFDDNFKPKEVTPDAENKD